MKTHSEYSWAAFPVTVFKDVITLSDDFKILMIQRCTFYNFKYAWFGLQVTFVQRLRDPVRRFLKFPHLKKVMQKIWISSTCIQSTYGSKIKVPQLKNLEFHQFRDDCFIFLAESNLSFFGKDDLPYGTKKIKIFRFTWFFEKDISTQKLAVQRR